MKLIFGIVLLVVFSFLANFLAQRVFPTFEKDNDERRFFYRLLVQFIGYGGFLSIAGLIYLNRDTLLGWSSNDYTVACLIAAYIGIVSAGITLQLWKNRSKPKIKNPLAPLQPPLPSFTRARDKSKPPSSGVPMSAALSTTPVAEPVRPILAVNNIEVIYDHVILVLKGVSVVVPKGGIVAILGANGAGKTTTLKAISNLLKAERGEVTKGSIEFEGERVDRFSPNELVKRGCIQVMEGRHCFGHLNIEENLLTGAFTRRDGNAAIKRDMEMVYDYFPRLRQRRTSMAGYTSGGEQQMCAIGRAMMSRPKMILLDEPSMGLAPQVVEEIFEIVKDLNAKENVSFLIAEQNTNMALKYATYGYIMETGRIVMDGEAKSLRENEDVKEFYLGIAEGAKKSFRDVKSYKRRKRWL
jgi:branched-chain amino acid transport system ATP-binding protein